MTADPPGTVAPLFTFGFERSGTTLLSMMLGSHPLLAVPYSPVGLWYRKARELDTYNQLQSAADRDRLIDDIVNDQRIKDWKVDFDEAALKRDLAPADYPGIVRRFHQAYAQVLGKPHWGLHDIATLYDMDLACGWFSDARFVHIIRDVRDVALSFVDYRYGSTNMCETAANWHRDVHASLKMGAILGPDRYLLIRYEDLVLQPMATLSAISRFAGLEYSSDMIDYAKTVTSTVPPDRMAMWPALGQPPDPGKVAQWRHRVAPHRARAIEEMAQPLLTDLGYPADDRPASAWRTEVYIQKCAFDRGHRLRRLKGKALRLMGRRDP